MILAGRTFGFTAGEDHERTSNHPVVSSRIRSHDFSTQPANANKPSHRWISGDPLMILVADEQIEPRFMRTPPDANLSFFPSTGEWTSNHPAVSTVTSPSSDRRWDKRLIGSLRGRIRGKIRSWARKRHGSDADPVVLTARRIYITPTTLGIAFALMVFVMFLGSMNYANNLALALTFMLGALGLTAMHHCHRNLVGLRVRTAVSAPVFAGQSARFRIALENTARLARHELTVAGEHGTAPAVRVQPDARAILELEVPAPRRGLLVLDHFEVATVHPFGLFRAWAFLHMDMKCIVYPRPAARGLVPPPTDTDTGGAQDLHAGDEDFSGLRSFHPGDSPRRIAWKNYAKEQGLQVKQYAATAVTSHVFSWDSLAGMDGETRLSQLCRWVEDAHAAGRAYGLRMPGTDIPANVGLAHRQRCLTVLALFDADRS